MNRSHFGVGIFGPKEYLQEDNSVIDGSTVPKRNNLCQNQAEKYAADLHANLHLLASN